MPGELKVKELFFDRKAVVDAVGRVGASALSRFGSFVRRRAKTSMRPGGKSGKVAGAGEPPRTHQGNLKKLLFFSWDPVARSVVVGPVAFLKGVVPSLMEHGGVSTQTRRERRSSRTGRKPTLAQIEAFRRKVASGQVDRDHRPLVTRSARYLPHPFMGPAMAREMPNMPAAWAAALQAGTSQPGASEP